MARRTSSASTGWWPGGAQDGRGLEMERWKQMKRMKPGLILLKSSELILTWGSRRVRSMCFVFESLIWWVFGWSKRLSLQHLQITASERCFMMFHVSPNVSYISIYFAFTHFRPGQHGDRGCSKHCGYWSADIGSFCEFWTVYGVLLCLWHLVASWRLWFPDFHAAPRMLRTSSCMWRSENVQIAGRLLNGPQSRMASTSVPCQNFGRAFTRTKHFALVNGLSEESAKTIYYTSRTIVYRSVRLESHNWSRKSVLDVLSIVEVYIYSV